MTKAKSLKRCWCMPCTNKKPPTILEAAFCVPMRKGYYNLADNGYEIDTRMMGVCDNCIKDLSDFQKNNQEPVDINDPRLIHRLA